MKQERIAITEITDIVNSEISFKNWINK